MFCSFDAAPKVLRIYGTGRAVLPADQDWPGLASQFGPAAGTGPAAGREAAAERGVERAIIVVAVDRIADSCGYAVPIMELTCERDLLARWSERESAEDLAAYRVKHNSESIDGLPGLG